MRVQKLLAAAVCAAVAVSGFNYTASADTSAADKIGGWDLHREGNKTVCSELEIDGFEYYKWLVNHDGDLSNDIDNDVDEREYYNGTPYIGWDHRNPKGDCEKAYGVRDIKGTAAMNCTGFVWHVLMKASLNSGKTLEWADKNIPVMGDNYNGKYTNGLMWIYNWLPTHKEVEYYYYGPGKYNSVVGAADAAVADGVLEYGDIIFLATTFDAHVGIYTGDGTTNEWWDSSSDNLGKNEWGDKVDLKYGAFKYLYVIKGGAENSVTLNVKTVSSNPELTDDLSLDYSMKDMVFDVFTDESCAQYFGSIKTTDDDGFGSFGMETGEQSAVRVDNGDYWVKPHSGNDFYSVGEEVCKFTSIGGSRSLFGGSSVFDGGEGLLNAYSENPYVMLSLSMVSDNPEATKNKKEYSFENEIFRILRKTDVSEQGEVIGYIKSDALGESSQYFMSDEEGADLDKADWIDGLMKVPYSRSENGSTQRCYYYAKEISSNERYKPFKDEIELEALGSVEMSGKRFAMLSAEIEKQGIPEYDDIVFGDVDLDGYICSLDSLIALRGSVQAQNMTEADVYLADADDDGEVTSSDALGILRYSVGLGDYEKIGQTADFSVYYDLIMSPFN